MGAAGDQGHQEGGDIMSSTSGACSAHAKLSILMAILSDWSVTALCIDRLGLYIVVRWPGW